MAPIKEAVYATLLMNDAYLPGAMVLGHSLRDKGAKARLVVLAVVENLSAATITELKTIYDEIISISRIVNKHPANLYLMDRPDLISTFTKIELWRQTQFRQIVYIDADMVAIRAPNELLSYDADFAAVPDIGWPDCFNSGLLVLRPNLADYYSLLALAQRGISFDGADQGLLNMHFQDWQRLSFVYNCTPSGSYQYIPAYNHFQSSISLIHFIGREKPWTLGREHRYTTGVYGDLLGRWWATYDRHYRFHTSYYSGQTRRAPRTVQFYVAGEKTAGFLGYSSSEPQADTPTEPPRHTSSDTAEAPSEQAEDVEETRQADISQELEPSPTPEKRPSLDLQSGWDASRAPPPANSRPEASNFPTQIYEFNHDTSLFQPPKYPEPPKDMYYQVPPKSPAHVQPKPLFPWEEHAPKPTRVFPPERPSSPQPEPKAESEVPHGVRTSSDASESSQISEQSGSTPSHPLDGDPWNSFTRTNAWDAMPEIERYVQAFARARRGKLEVMQDSMPLGVTEEPLTSPPAGADRRPSVRLTDFPTEVERPSLPVTPAPRRPSFWGEERDEAGELPPAQGVPKQQDWNPIEKLEELQRKQSEVLRTGPELTPKELPSREMPGTAMSGAAGGVAATGPASPPATPKESDAGEQLVLQPRTAETSFSPTTPKPILKEPSFELAGPSKEESPAPPIDLAPERLSPDVSTSA